MDGFLHQPLKIEEWVGILLLVGMVGGVAISIVAIVTDYFRRSRRDEMDATLKMEMLERGMSADEIIKVLRTRGRKSDGSDSEANDEAAMAGQASSCRQARRAWRDAMRQHAPGE